MLNLSKCIFNDDVAVCYHTVSSAHAKLHAHLGPRHDQVQVPADRLSAVPGLLDTGALAQAGVHSVFLDSFSKIDSRTF